MPQRKDSSLAEQDIRATICKIGTVAMSSNYGGMTYVLLISRQLAKLLTFRKSPA
jgi:proline racemase